MSKRLKNWVNKQLKNMSEFEMAAYLADGNLETPIWLSYKIIATTSQNDNTIRIWDNETGNENTTFIDVNI